MMKRFALAAVAALMLSGCHHKNLEPFEPTGDLEVVFDWREAPDANPASMAFTMYPESGEDPVAFMFENRTGGSIRAEGGSYRALCLNSDISDWARLRNREAIETFEVLTPDAEQLEAQNLDSGALPKARGAESERIASTPGMLWGSTKEGITVDPLGGHQVITMYPEERVCHYTVDVIDVENASSVRGAALDATLSGMAEGYLHGLGKPTDTPVTMSFMLTLADNDKDLHGEFLTFGECPVTKADHILSIYAALSDGSKTHFTADVTTQVSGAEEPTHVHIIVRGLKLPKVQQGGFSPNVKDWEHVEIDLDMGAGK